MTNKFLSQCQSKSTSNIPKSEFVKDKDKLKVGNCVCLIRNKYTGEERLANGSVDRVPYTKNASKETKQKYGRNLVYVIHYQHEEIIGYKQIK